MENGQRQKSREVRLGLVMYGGVSLAIYINGVANELFRAVRGRGVYRLIKKLTDSDIVVDVLSGTSAGGINGIFLAYALCNEVEFATCAELWRIDGDIDLLLRKTDRPLDEYRSLLDSEGYYQPRLEAAFARMQHGKISPDVRAKEDPSPVEELDLMVTGTDFAGRITDTVDDRQQVVQVKDHRTLFWLKHRKGRKQPFNPTEPLDDVPPPTDPAVKPAPRADLGTHEALAKLARITSCFPAAFAPVTVQGDIGGADARLRRWGDLPEHQDRVFIDGGVLDNKPFTSTLEAIYHRMADGPVTRHLLYVEPDPERFQPTSSVTAPNLVRTAIDSLTRLPAYESIAGDLRSLSEHNNRVMRMDMVAKIPRTIGGDQRLHVADDNGVAAETYRKARLTGLMDGLFSAVFETAPGELPKNVDDRQRLEGLSAWFKASLLDPPGVGQVLLDGVDVDRRMRRLLQLTYGDFDEEWKQHPHLLATINNQIQTLEIVRSAMQKAAHAACLGMADKGAAETWSAVDSAIELILRAAEPAGYDKSGAEILARIDRPRDGGGGPLLDDAARREFKAALARAAANPAGGKPRPRSVLTAADDFEDKLMTFVGGRVEAAYRGFDALDRTLFPLEVVSGVREKDVIHTIRVSPVDARIGLCDKPIDQKVTGINVGHFGAFFKRSWRSNDILWGRLDSACELVEVLMDEERLLALDAPDRAGRRKLPGLIDEVCGALDSYVPYLSATRQKELKGHLEEMKAGRDAIKAKLPIVREMLIEVAHRDILVDGLKDVIADAGSEQMRWNEFKSKPKARNDMELDARTLQFAAGSHVLDPAVIAVSAAKLAQDSIEKAAKAGKSDELVEIFEKHYKVGEETLDDIPRVVLLHVCSRALLVLRNCLLLVLGARADKVRGSAIYKLFFDWPLRALAALAGGLRRAPAGRGAFIVGSLCYAVACGFVIYQFAPHYDKLQEAAGDALSWGLGVLVGLPLLLLGASLFLVSNRSGGGGGLSKVLQGGWKLLKFAAGVSVASVLVALCWVEPARLCEPVTTLIHVNQAICENQVATFAVKSGAILTVLSIVVGGLFSGVRSWLDRRFRKPKPDASGAEASARSVGF